jgi:hypothetical protein
MIKPIVNPIVLAFTLAIALAPSGALAEASGYGAPGAPPWGLHHHRAHKTTGEARLARPAPAQPSGANLPAISRNPEDCTKTMCTCLQGGGC